jgi:hypothetical protein
MGSCLIKENKMFNLIFRVLSAIVKKIGTSEDFTDGGFIYSYKNKLWQLDVFSYLKFRVIELIIKNICIIKARKSKSSFEFTYIS